MSKVIRNLIALAYTFGVTGSGFGRDVVEVHWDATVREYCHILRFPFGWSMPKFKTKPDGTLEPIPLFDVIDGDYEFRAVGLSSTKFLVRGVDRYGLKNYTPEIYGADLSDSGSVAYAATKEEWDSAAIVPLLRGSNGIAISQPQSKYVEVQGVRYGSTGDHWERQHHFAGSKRTGYAKLDWQIERFWK